MSSAGTLKVIKTWHDSRQIKKRTKYLLEHIDSIPTDVTFRVGSNDDTEDISAHRLILGLGSSVFHAMFYGDVREKNKIIRIPDVEPEAFRIMIGYLYSEDIAGLTMNNVMENIYCAKKYLVLRLLKQCRIFVQDNLTPESASFIFTQTVRICEDRLGQLAATVISHQIVKASASPHFLNMTEVMVRALLQRNDLSGTEYDIYQAARRWAFSNGRPFNDAKESFAGIIDCLRLPLLTSSQMALGPAKDGAVSDSEIKDLYIHKYSSVNKPTIRFSSERRNPHPDRCYGVLSVNVEEANGEIVVGGTVHLELYTEIAPGCCKLFRELSETDRYFLSYGSCLFFSPPHGAGVYKTLPVENELLSHAPMWVSMVTGDEETGSCVRELHIGHAEEKFRADEGTVFARVVGGFDLLDRMHAVNRGLLTKWEDSLKEVYSGTQAGVGISFVVRAEPVKTIQQYASYLEHWPEFHMPEYG